MSDTPVSGFAHAINRLLESIGAPPALTAYVSSLSTSIYGFASFNEVLGVCGLLISAFVAGTNWWDKRELRRLAREDMELRIAEARARRVVNTPAAPAAAQDPAKAG